MREITFKLIVPGYRALFVDGVRRPIQAVRKGRGWFVTSAPFGGSNRDQDRIHGRVPRLSDAKSLMIAAWMSLESERNLAEHEAFEQELERLTAVAAELGITELPQPEYPSSLAARVRSFAAQIEEEMVRVQRACVGDIPVGDDHPDFFLHVAVLTRAQDRIPGFQSEWDTWGCMSNRAQNVMVRQAAEDVRRSL